MNREELLKVAKPILFSTEMVRAILDRRKTMTRRVVKPPLPDCRFYSLDVDLEVCYGGDTDNTEIIKGLSATFEATGDYAEDFPIRKSRYKVGDILYVRETWLNADDGFYYKSNETPYSKSLRDSFGYKWKPSIFMPKSAARIFLKVTVVRVERLQDILCGDMMKEGCIPETVKGGQWQQWQQEYWVPLWNGINAKRGYGWDTNPWVWVYELEMMEV